jgi:protein-tyrosine phosphatase
MKNILFVCLGNICRSPLAEAIMNEYIAREGMNDEISCDSAGILNYHQGEPADKRMKLHARRRGYTITSISRPVNSMNDFDRFDMIIGMDQQNIRDLKTLARTKKDQEKIFLMTDFLHDSKFESVPDPYFGGEEGFELVLDILEEACKGLLDHLKKE